MTPGSLMPGAAGVIADDPHSQTRAHYLGAEGVDGRAMARLRRGRLEHDLPRARPGEAERLTGIRAESATHPWPVPKNTT